MYAAVALATAPLIAQAAQLTATWNGGSGLWGQPGRWSGGVLPLNRDGDTYDVLIDGGNAASSTVTIGSYEPAASWTVDSITIDNDDTLAWPAPTNADHRLTALKGMTVNGSLRTTRSFPGGQLHVGADEAFAGSGTITVQNVVADSIAGSVTFGSGLTVIGHEGTLGNRTRPTITRGLVWASGAPLDPDPQVALTVAGSTLTSTGTFKVSTGCTLAFDTAFGQMSDLGTLVNEGGTFRVAGTLDNAGRTFALNSATGDWQLTGTMRGGTLSTTDGKSLSIINSSAVLDDVQINGSVRIGVAGRWTLPVLVTLPAGQGLSGNGTVTLTDWHAGICSAGGTFTIGPGMTVRGLSSYTPSECVGNATRPTVNQGRVLAEGGVLMIAGSTLSNTGIFESGPGGVLAFGGGPYTLADLGTLKKSGGAFRIAGFLDNSGRTFVIDDTSVDWQLGGSGSNAVDAATIKGGTLNIAPGRSILLPSGTTSVFDDVVVNGTVRFEPATGAIHASVPAGQTLHGNPEFIFNAPSSLGQFITGPGGLEIGNGVVIRGNGGAVGDPAAGPLVNHGLLRAEGPTRSMDVAGSAIMNLGTIESTGGQVNLIGTYTRASLGNVVNNTAVAIAGTMNNAGQTTTLDDGPGTWRLIRGGTIVGGTINIPTGDALVIGSEAATSSPSSSSATLDGVAVTGVIRVNGQLRILNGLSGTNEIIGGGQGSIVAPGTLTIPATTSIRYTINTNTFRVGDGTQAVVNEGDINAEQLRINVEGTSVANAGRMRVTSFGSMSVITPQMTNTGDIEIAKNCGITISRNTSGGAGTTAFATGGTLQVELGALGSSPGKLAVVGSLDLSTLDDFLELVVPPNTSSFPQTIVTYTGTLTGTFDHVPSGVAIDYATPNQIRVIAVPEPASGIGVILLASGAALARRVRGRAR